MRICDHGRSTHGCFECAREVLLVGHPDARSVAGSIGRSVQTDLEARERYIGWLERRVRELEEQKRDIRASVGAGW